jgi:hypothetical protein
VPLRIVAKHFGTVLLAREKIRASRCAVVLIAVWILRQSFEAVTRSGKRGQASMSCRACIESAL